MRSPRRVRPAGVRYLWEPRGNAWTLRASLARELCTELDLVHVIDPFVTPPSGNGDAYYRLHGVTGARHVYTDSELHRLVEMTPAGKVLATHELTPRSRAGLDGGSGNRAAACS